MNRIDFTDRGVADVYGDMTDCCVSALSAFYDDMERLCKNHGYKPMVDFANNIQTFYEEDFRRHVMNCFQQWESSEASIPALARAVYGGSDAERTAEGYTTQLRERIESLFARKFSRVQVEVDAPALDEHDIEKINDMIREFLDKLNRGTEQTKQTLRAGQQRNVLYYLITPVLRNTWESLYTVFKSLFSAVEEGSELFQAGVRATLDELTFGTIMDDHETVKWPENAPFY